MDFQEQVKRTARRLGVADEDANRDIAERFTALYEEAMSICHRTQGEETEALLSIVRDAVAAEFQKRGDEGLQSTSVGGQSHTYEDTREMMFRRLLRSGQRMARL